MRWIGWWPFLACGLSVGLVVGASPWIVSDELWDRIDPLLPKRERRFRYPGRRPVPDREVLCGILFVLHTGIQWEHLPQELGFGSGMTCWRRLRDWNEASVAASPRSPARREDRLVVL
jgi:transposase